MFSAGPFAQCTYRRKKDEAEVRYWGAARHLNGDHHTLYLGKVREHALSVGCAASWLAG